MDFSSKKNKNETELKETNQQESSTPTIKTINSDVTVVTDELIVSNDSWISTNKSDSCKTKLKSSLPKIPDEMSGTGANKNVNYLKYLF